MAKKIELTKTETSPPIPNISTTIGEVTAISSTEYKVGNETVREIKIVIGGNFTIGKKVEVKEV